MVRLQRYNIQEGKCKKFLKNVNENKTAYKNACSLNILFLFIQFLV